MAELLTVAQKVVGSRPIAHPKTDGMLGGIDDESLYEMRYS